jgi:hypothetical protein
MRRKKHKYQPARILRQTLRNLRLSDEAERIFTNWPGAKLIACNLCQYISPMLVLSTGESVLEMTLAEAIGAYYSQRSDDIKAYRAFVRAAVRGVEHLRTLRISLELEAGDWVVWDMEQPIMVWMDKHDRDALQVRELGTPEGDRAALLVSAAQHCLSVRDVEIAGLRMEWKDA